MFASREDVYSKIREIDLSKIVGREEVVVDHAKSYAMGVVRSLIPQKYDVEKIFAARGEERDGLILSFVIDIAIYEIVARVQPNIDLEDRRERRNQAISYLRQVRKEDLPTGWPLLPDDDNQGGVIYGGNPRRGSHF